MKTEQELWADYLPDKSIESRNALAEYYIPLSNYFAQWLQMKLNSAAKIGDIRQYAMLGLFDAISKFDPTKGVKFKTYCALRIRGAVFDGLRKEDWVPRLVRERSDDVRGFVGLVPEARNRPDTRVPDPSATSQRRDLLKLVTNGMTKNERLILILYYYENQTFSAIAATIGLCESRISQIHTGIVARLKDKLKGRQEEFVL